MGDSKKQKGFGFEINNGDSGKKDLFSVKLNNPLKGNGDPFANFENEFSKNEKAG